MRVRVVETFRSFQGEGPRAGEPAEFIRLAGCNRNCEWCDTRAAQDPAAGVMRELEDLLPRRGLVIITGGEPLYQLSEKQLR